MDHTTRANAPNLELRDVDGYTAFKLYLVCEVCHPAVDRRSGSHEVATKAFTDPTGTHHYLCGTHAAEVTTLTLMDFDDATAVLDNLSDDERTFLGTLLRGVRHSGTARERFNEWCFQRHLHPNAVLALSRPATAPTPAPRADA